MKFEFVEEKQRYNAKIKVVGVGGAGGNAINNMIAANLKGVEFFTANTDSQDLERSACSNKIQLGATDESHIIIRLNIQQMFPCGECLLLIL